MKALLLAFLLMIAATPFMDAWADPCSASALNPMSVSSSNLLDRISNWFRELGGKSEDSAQAQSGKATPPDGLYFTKSSGFSGRPKCEGEKRFFTHLYYPIGLVVRKISEEKFGNQTYALVEAEHGLTMYILPNALEPLDRDKTYIFADSARLKGYCSQAKCSLADEQDAVEEKRTLNPRDRYAVAEGKWEECRREGDQPIAKARLYDRDHKPLLRKDGTDQIVFVRYCLEPEPVPENSEALRPDPKVKIVRYDRYAKVFDEPPRGTYQRFSRSLMEKLLPGYTSIKECNETATLEQSDKVSGSAKIQLPLYVVALAGEAERSLIKNTVSKPGKDTFDTDDEILAIGGDGLEKWVWGCWHVTMNQRLPSLVQDAEVHGTSMQINAAVKLVLVGVESHEVSSSFLSDSLPLSAYHRGMLRRGPQ